MRVESISRGLNTCFRSRPWKLAASSQARADRLRNIGMSDAQIEEMTTKRTIPEDVYIVSPADGFILSRNISPGLRFEREREFYTIGNLSEVWILAQVFGKDAETFRAGAMAKVTLPDTVHLRHWRHD